MYIIHRLWKGMVYNMNKDDCIFCKIAVGEIPSQTIYEDDDFRFFLDVSPATDGHALIIPKNHYDNLLDLTDDMAAKTMKLAKKAALCMKTALKCDGINLVQNNGKAAGQTVFHYHLHLIPRYEGGKTMVVWEPGTVEQNKLTTIRQQLSEQLEKELQ